MKGPNERLCYMLLSFFLNCTSKYEVSVMNIVNHILRLFHSLILYSPLYPLQNLHTTTTYMYMYLNMPYHNNKLNVQICIKSPT